VDCKLGPMSYVRACVRS